MTKAFTSNTKSHEELVNVDAPLFHVVPYVTGGYQRLLHMIKNNSIPDLAEFGYHTNSEGHFDPKGECVIGLRYKVKKILDTKGQSAVLVLAQDEFFHKTVVIKVLHTKFYQLGGQESNVLRKLAVADPLNHSHTLRLLTTVTFDSHYCLVFDPLLPQPLTAVFSNIPSNRILGDLRRVGLRLLASVGFLHQQNLIHTDLKPENILLKQENELESVHIVDFGNTISFVHSEVSLYYKDFELQTPLYRAPEVMFGVPFGPEIDIWSLGCVLAELFLGKPLFFGSSKEEIMEKMTALLGPYPSDIFRRGKFFRTYKKYTREENQPNCTLKLLEHLQCKDIEFANLIAQMLKYNPEERLTAAEAARHPFFACYLPLAFLLPKTTGSSSYPSLSLSKSLYSHSPYIPADIRRQPLSSLDLLRQGTARLPNLEDKPIIKPSPRRGVCAGNHLLQSTKNEEECSAKEGNKLSAKVQSDISVVRNFIVSEDQKSFSDNVKDKMSALLEVIREEQNCVEDDLERRSNFSKAERANRTCRSGTEECKLPRPCPRYGRFQTESDEKKTLLLQNSKNSSVDEDRSYGVHGKLPKGELIKTEQNLREINKTMPKDRRLSATGKADKMSSCTSAENEVKYGSPTYHGVKERKYHQQLISSTQKSSLADRKMLSVLQSEVKNSSSCSNNSGTVADGDLMYMSGSEHDGSDSSEYSTNPGTDSSPVGVSYSGNPGGGRRLLLSTYSTHTSEMNKIKEKVRLKRLKSGRQIPKHQQLESSSKKRHHSSSNLSGHTAAQTLLPRKHHSQNNDLHNTKCSAQGFQVTSNSKCQTPPISGSRHGFSSEIRSQGSSNRKRLASDRISDDEEYVELLSPMATGSNKKKLKSENKTRYAMDRNIMDVNNTTDREYQSESVRLPECFPLGKVTASDISIHRHGTLQPTFSKRKHDKYSIERKLVQDKKETRQFLTRDADVMPAAYSSKERKSNGMRHFSESESPVSVTPIKREKSNPQVHKWELESPEIVYKGSISENRGKSIQIKETCRLDGKEKVKTLPEELTKKSVCSVNSLSTDRNRNKSHRLSGEKSVTDLEFGVCKHVRSNPCDQKQHKVSDHKVTDYSFRDSPDTDLKQLASRGGYAESIERISKKKKKARKSLAFEKNQAVTKRYTHEYDEQSCSDASFDDDDDDELCINSQVNKIKYRLPQTSTLNTQLKAEKMNQMFSEENTVTHGKNTFKKDRIKAKNLYGTGAVSCTNTFKGPTQKGFKGKKFDSTFTIDFESPLRNSK